MSIRDRPGGLMTATSDATIADAPAGDVDAGPLEPGVPDYVDNTTVGLGRSWYPVALASEVSDTGPVAVELLGTHWALARLKGELVAFVDECPHRLLPLSAGRICGAVLQCGYHGWRYDERGVCVDIPSQDADRPISARAKLRRPFGVAERYGVIWLAPLEPVAPIPAMPEWDDSSFEVRIDAPARTTAGAQQALDNGCDSSHFVIVHAGTFGGDAAAQSRAKSVVRDGWTVSATYETVYRVLDDPDGGSDVRPVEQISLHTKTVVAASSLMLRMEFPMTASVFTILASVQPEHDGSTRLYRWFARNDIVGDEERWAACLEIERAVQAEDLVALGAFRDHRLPLDLRREVHVADDKMSLVYRRMLADLVRS
jgi:phenylpropionate dioxygenase-like ring-hydroxylating dioxygenase large terminal subunit